MMSVNAEKPLQHPSIGDMCSPDQAYALAVAEGSKGAGWVAPNPLVGCVVVSSSGRLLASGYHARCGQAHAEVNALDKVAPEDRVGATVYVTLEPCSHYGRTPPCSERLIKDKVKKVIVGVRDPNPLVSGRGIDQLKQAGIEVLFNESFEKMSRRLAEQFLWNMTQKKPFLTLKLAMSLDGQIALKNGESQWLTSESSREYARCLRAHHDATLVGAQTVLQDNPLLDFRQTEFEGTKKNKIIIWDPKNKVDSFLKSSRLLKTHGAEAISVIRTLDEECLQQLYAQGVTAIYVEGGAHTLSQLIDKRLFNKIYVFIAPVLLGQGRSWTEGIQLMNMAQKLNLRFNTVVSGDSDIFIEAYPQ